MNQYYICKPGSTQEGPYPENMIRACLIRGVYPAGTLVWREGMENWKKIEYEFSADTSAPDEAPPAPPATQPRKRKTRQKKLRVGNVLLTPQPRRRGWLFFRGLLRSTFHLAMFAACIWGGNYFYVNYMDGTDFYAVFQAKKELKDFGITKESYDRKLIHYAVLGDCKMVKLLLLAGANADSYGKYGGTSLHMAAHMNNADIATLLLAHGADCNALTKTGKNEFTPLMEAIKGKADDVMDILLKAGADPDARNTNGGTPLHLAVIEKNSSAVRILLAGGAKVNNEALGFTPLQIAREMNAPDEIIQMLINAGGR